MIFLLILTGSVIILYGLFIAYIASFTKFETDQYNEVYSRVTIIIPCRNEAHSIGYCLDSIVKQSMIGTQFDVIVVDDFSEDITIHVAEQYLRNLSLKILRNNLPGKKNALSIGIEKAETDIIITTDADCTMGPEWLSIMLNKFENEKLNMLCGPVNFNPSEVWFEQLQQTESAAIMGISAAMLNNHKPATCNGANLMFKKSIHYQLGGYHSHRNIASGDDDLMMHAFFNYDSEKVKFCMNKRAMVFTKASQNFIEFIYQRIRWMSKRKYYTYRWNEHLQILIMLQLLSFYFLLIVLITTSNVFALGIILLKFIIDLYYGYKLQKGFRFNFFQILLMPFFESYILLVLLFSFLKKKQWKGRTI